MRPEDLAEGIRAILEHSPAFSRHRLVVDIIANPKAGGFKRPRFALARKRELAAMVERARHLPERAEPIQVRLHLTARGGHASAIAQRVIERSESNGQDCLHVLLTAGGDGTSLETAERLINLPPGMADRFALLRLPLGTGNDGSEGRDLTVALGRFLGPARFERRSSVRVTPSSEGGKLPIVACNIASVGFDAYVADRTNTLKRVFPGDSYKFWVNVATMLYERAYEMKPMRLRAWDHAGMQIIDDEAERLFVALGASGFRQYGSGKRILPGTENGIAVSETTLFRKLLVKGAIERGMHEGIREVRHFDASRLEIGFDGDLPLQCDGEVDHLASCDFPLTMELVPESYNVISPLPPA